MIVPWRHLVNNIDLCRSPKSPKKIHKTPYFGVQGHSRSLNLAPIESQCTTFYSNLRPYLAPLLRCSDLLAKNRKFCRRWRFGNFGLDRFWLIHPCDRETDRQNCDALKAVAAFARKKLIIIFPAIGPQKYCCVKAKVCPSQKVTITLTTPGFWLTKRLVYVSVANS